MQNVLMVVNPVAGKGNIKNRLNELKEKFKDPEYNLSLLRTRHKGDAFKLVKDSGHNYDIIICCGGDGTINEVISGVYFGGSKARLGFIPCGTTNDYAMTMGIPTDILKAADVILEGRISSFDIGILNNQNVFSYVAAFGLFSAVSYTTSQDYKNVLGRFAYFLEGIKDLLHIQSYKVSGHADGAQFSGEYIFGAVSNSFTIGGLLKLDIEQEQLRDGLLELLLVRMPKNIVDVSTILHALNTQDFDNEFLEFHKASKMELEFEEPLDWSLDGEHAKTDDKAIIENQKKAIHIFI